MAETREHQRTHPWLSFHLDLQRVGYRLWMLLGEARSKCEHIAGVPLREDVARELHSLYMAKGAFATTAIEGNTLTEEQVREHLAGKLKLPPSKEYLAQEIDNIVEVFNLITSSCQAGVARLTPEILVDYNRRVLQNLTLDEDVVPGELRCHSVVVMRYRGAPAQDCEYLLRRLCDWLESPEFRGATEEDRVMLAILKAVLAHLYIAWIHPFGDGNGRTARLVEFQILMSSGLPQPVAHLLSNHYNSTRAEYYRQLDYASKSGGDVSAFIEYAVSGFVEGLRAQLETIRQQQWDIAWRDFIFRTFKEQNLRGATDDRRRELALALSTASSPVPLSKIWALSPRTAQAYTAKHERTVQRDLEALIALELVIRKPTGYAANRDKILQFLPLRCD